jgi:hypothetical protein
MDAKLSEEHTLRVFENGVLRRIFGPKRDEVTGDRLKLHNEGLNSLYFSPSIIKMMKSRRMRWPEHVARMGRRGMNTGYWWESQKESLTRRPPFTHQEDSWYSFLLEAESNPGP